MAFIKFSNVILSIFLVFFEFDLKTQPKDQVDKSETDSPSSISEKYSESSKL